MTMLVRLSQSLKAYFPIEMTESGMTMLVRLLHQEKAPSPIEVTESGMEYSDPVFPLG